MRPALSAVAALVLVVACRDEAPPKLRVLVTNDDGVGAAGLDAIVEALRASQPPADVTIIAPAEDQTNLGCRTTTGALTTRPAATKSGAAATAVVGYPVDTVVHALDRGGVSARPHLVVSGINDGQNLGPLVELSGTVSAARAAAARGVPALAVSQGRGEPTDFRASVRLALDWIAAHRDALVSGTAAAEVTSLNAPACAARGLLTVPVATGETGALDASDCTSTATGATTDVDAFRAGYATQSPITPACQAVAASDGGVADAGALGPGIELDGETCFEQTNGSAFACSDLKLNAKCAANDECAPALGTMCFLFNASSPDYQTCTKGAFGACTAADDCGRGGRCCQWKESFGLVHGCRCK